MQGAVNLRKISPFILLPAQIIQERHRQL